ncbi:methionine--tRNA ligase, partial [Myxococcota bacterium]|nr:methionine--tRNA ligase [Myxococcota bacterium]
IFQRLRDNGLVYEEEVEQFYCDHDARFLPDRFVRGICPKCHAPDQYGDSCEKCGTTYSPTELVSPLCSLCANPPVRRSSKHYFVDLEKAREPISTWVDDETHLHEEIRTWLKKNFLENPLRPWDISRDAPYFGFTIPGETDKFFYVWMDAPVGYIGTTQKFCQERQLDFAAYWEREVTEKDPVRIVHVIGKDITYFHTLFWPAMLHYGGYTMPSRVQIHGFLTVNGEKMSKSRGTSVTGRTYLRHLDPQYLRFYYASKLGSGIDDLDLNLEEFKNRVDAELVNKVANLASRTVSLLSKRLDATVGAPDPAFSEILLQAAASSEKIAAWYETFEFSRVIREVSRIAEMANKYLQDTEPFRLIKDEPEKARAILSSALGMVKGLAILLGPVLPQMKATVESMLNGSKIWTWQDLDFHLPEGTVIGPFERLVERVDEKAVEAMIEDTRAQFEEAPVTSTVNYAPLKEEITFDDFAKIDCRVGTILTAELVEKAQKLLKLTVDIGLETRTVFAGIRSQFDPAFLVGKKVAVVANLKPRKMKFGVSEAMVIAAENPGSGELALLTPLRELDPEIMVPGALLS